jgi:hypothetical protein
MTPAGGKPVAKRPAAEGAGRPVARRAAAADTDEAVNLKLPARVIKKKRSRDPERIERSGEPAERLPASELLVPFVLIGVGLAGTVATSVWQAEGITDAGFWVAIRMGIVVASMAITMAALFLAAPLLDTEYGLLKYAIPKVAAIVLTQAWVADLTGYIPFIGWVISYLVTYGMFKFFFDLDDIEAIASMAVVRLTHWAAVSFLFIAAFSFLIGGGALLDQPADIEPGIENVLPDEDEPDDMGADGAGGEVEGFE